MLIVLSDTARRVELRWYHYEGDTPRAWFLTILKQWFWASQFLNCHLLAIGAIMLESLTPRRAMVAVKVVCCGTATSRGPPAPVDRDPP